MGGAMPVGQVPVPAVRSRPPWQVPGAAVRERFAIQRSGASAWRDRQERCRHIVLGRGSAAGSCCGGCGRRAARFARRGRPRGRRASGRCLARRRWSRCPGDCTPGCPGSAHGCGCVVRPGGEGGLEAELGGADRGRAQDDLAGVGHDGRGSAAGPGRRPGCPPRPPGAQRLDGGPRAAVLAASATGRRLWTARARASLGGDDRRPGLAFRIGRSVRPHRADRPATALSSRPSG